jgi:hypothetical protein
MVARTGKRFSEFSCRRLKSAFRAITSASIMGKTCRFGEKALDAGRNPPNLNCIVTVWAGGPLDVPIPPAD